jgi:hypothetical protein
MSDKDVNELHDELVEENVEVTDEELMEESEDSLEEAKKPCKKEEMDSEEEDDEEDEDEEEMEESFKADLDALVSSEATLSEGFRSKAAIIFEAAIKSNVAKEVARIEEAYTEQLDEEVAAIKSDLIEKVDGYLNYVVESWMEENKLAIETGLRADIAESFIDSLKTVFTEHYIDVPEGKANLVDELAERVESIEEKYSKAVDDSIRLSAEVEALTREKIVYESATDLSVAQAEKLKALVEDIDYVDAKSFADKVETIKESYFKQVPTVKDEAEEIAESDKPVEISASMKRYVDALKKNF